MNIYELRQAIHVTEFSSGVHGCTIYYDLLFDKGKIIRLDSKILVDELILLGSVDESFPIEAVGEYILSQWDALNIAIRFELAREQQNELDNSDIFKAIGDIIKPK